jgi:hypothetical protein
MVKKKPKLWKELLFIFLVPVPIMVVILLTVLNTDVKPWEAGLPIPVEQPLENRRVFSTKGFSIIAPPNWTHRDLDDLTMLHLIPRQVNAGRSKAGMVITLLHEKPSDLAESEDAIFRGNPAYLKVERRPTTFDDPAFTMWTFYLHQNGKWFDLSYFVADAHDEMPAMARRCLETVRLLTDE